MDTARRFGKRATGSWTPLAALWKLPALSSSMKMAEARESAPSINLLLGDHLTDDRDRPDRRHGQRRDRFTGPEHEGLIIEVEARIADFAVKFHHGYDRCFGGNEVLAEIIERMA